MVHFRETELGALSDEEFVSHLLAVESMKLEKVREGGREGGRDFHLLFIKECSTHTSHSFFYFLTTGQEAE